MNVCIITLCGISIKAASTHFLNNFFVLFSLFLIFEKIIIKLVMHTVNKAIPHNSKLHKVSKWKGCFLLTIHIITVGKNAESKGRTSSIILQCFLDIYWLITIWQVNQTPLSIKPRKKHKYIPNYFPPLLPCLLYHYQFDNIYWITSSFMLRLNF